MMKAAFQFTLFFWLALGEAFAANGGIALPLTAPLVVYTAAVWPPAWGWTTALLFGLILDGVFARPFPEAVFGLLLAAWLGRVVSRGRDERARRGEYVVLTGVWNLGFGVWFYWGRLPWWGVGLAALLTGIFGAVLAALTARLLDVWGFRLHFPHRKLPERGEGGR